MSQDLESFRERGLEGRFFSFTHSDSGGVKVIEKAVPKDFTPAYNFTTQPLESSRRGGLTRAARQQKLTNSFWVESKVASLKKLNAEGMSARRIGRLLGISRYEIGKKLNELGILNRYGRPYYVER